MKELEDIFNPKIENLEIENYKHFNDINHNDLNVSKEINEQTEQLLNTENKLKKEDKKKFLIQNKLIKKKIENEKNKERLYKLSSFENFFISSIKRFSCIRENKMIYQIYVLYIFLFIIFIVSLVYVKYIMIKRSFKDYLEQNYFPFIETEVVKTQNILKIKSDEKNNKNIISTLDDEMLFMEIYSKELIRNDIIKKENIIFGDNVENGESDDNEEEMEKNKTYEDYLGKIFRINGDIKDLIMKNVEDVENDNLKNLIIYYYNFIPIIYQHFDSLGLNLINFYFSANMSCENDNNKNLFFKYPLEQNDYGIDIELTNDKIFDYIIDPFIPCNSGFDLFDNEELISKIGENNWYYNLYNKVEEKEINFRFFQIMKINPLHKRKDYFIAYDKFNYDDINFLFAIRISKPDIVYPFIKFN